MSEQDAAIWLVVILAAPFAIALLRVLWGLGGLLSAKADSIRCDTYGLKRWADA